MSFLMAEWNNLAMINYAIDPKILGKYDPAGTELDFFEGKCFVSFSGFLSDRQTIEYQVNHPRWKQPTSIFVAVGSKISIEKKRKINC